MSICIRKTLFKDEDKTEDQPRITSVLKATFSVNTIDCNDNSHMGMDMGMTNLPNSIEPSVKHTNINLPISIEPSV